MTTIIHNPKCSKSKAALDFLKGRIEEIEVLDYLNGALNKEELKGIIQQLNIKPEQLIRKSEQVYIDQFEGKTFTDEAWLDILLEHPELIERPIVIHNGKAAIGRPLEAVIALLEQ